MAEEKAKNKEKNRARQKETPVWEWIIAAFGLVLVVVAIGIIAYRAATKESTPPILEISDYSIVSVNKGYLVKFRVKNSGSQTAAALMVEGTLKQGEKSVETSTATLTYAPAYSEREGGLFFNNNPNEFEIQIRALGYEKP